MSNARQRDPGAPAKAADLISKAKAKLIINHPFFAALTLNLPLEQSYDTIMGTLQTDGKKIQYDPDFVAGLSVRQAMFALCHEVMHNVFTHMFRRGSRDPMLWNVAGDFIINGILKDDEKMELIDGCLYNPQIVKDGGGTTEGVYELLKQDAEKNGGAGGGDGPQPFDYVTDGPADPAERAEAEAKVKVQIAQAAQAAKMMGKLPAGIERLVEEAIKPKVDWKDVLREFVSTRAKVDYTFARPKRRFLADDLYLPSLSGEQMGEIVVDVDMSGSIGPEEAAEFLAEMRAIKEDCRPSRMHVLYFDADVAGMDTFERDEELEFKPRGGGGTAYSPNFAYTDERDIRPVCRVVLTDLYCNDYPDVPDYPVLWITNSDCTKAPWGRVVQMKR